MVTAVAEPETQAGQEITALVERSRRAQAQIEDYTQEQVDALIRAMVWSVCQPGVAERIARQAVTESRLGSYDGKLLKMTRKIRAVLADIINDKSVGVIHVDPVRHIFEVAKPVGVIGALSTSTHPEATPVAKAIQAVKGRNAIIIAPHPRGKGTNRIVCDLMREAIVKMGAPADLVIGIDEPTLEGTNELMRQCDRILATGGAAMVKAAYSSGTPALGVGVGNAVITVDETADIADAAEKIRLSKTFDEATSCSADNSVIALRPIREALLEALEAQGGYLVSADEYDKVARALWQEGLLNRDLICQPALPIATAAGLNVPEGTKFIIVPEDNVGPDHPFSGEKLSVVMAFYTVDTIDEAIDLTNRIQRYQGLGHSCGLYTRSDDNIMKFALRTRTSRVLVNQPQSLSNSGALWNGLRQTFSLGCGSWGGNSTTNNITWSDLVNITRVSKPLPSPKTIPDDRTLFGDVIERLGSFGAVMKLGGRMKTTRAILAAAAIAAASFGVTVMSQTPPSASRTVLQTGDLSVAGREAVTARGDFPAGAVLGMHTHPGEEIGYLLEGSLTFEMKGQAPRSLKPGDVFLVPAGTPHSARNTGTVPAKVLATYVVEKGKPLATPVP